MRKLLYLTLFIFPTALIAQEIKLKKGGITQNIPVNDSIKESYSVFLPSTYDPGAKWPLMIVTDMEGTGQQSLAMFKAAAEEEQYILAASDNLSDTLSLTGNVRVIAHMFDGLTSLLRLDKNRIYTGGSMMEREWPLSCPPSSVRWTGYSLVVRP